MYGLAGFVVRALVLLANGREFPPPFPRCRTCSTQAYTQHGGLRPWGVSMLLAGWDESRGLQLYKTEPSGRSKQFP